MHALCTLPSFRENIHIYICIYALYHPITCMHKHTESPSHTYIRGEQAAHKCAHPSYSVSRNNYVLLDSKRQAHIPLTRNRAHTPVFCTYIFYSRIFVDFNSFLVLWRFNYHVDAFTTAFGHFDCFPF